MSTSTAATGADADRLSGIERRFLAAWPALETRWDGAWVWRAARGYTKRANAIQCQHPDDDADAEARLVRLAGWSRQAGIAPMFRQTPLAGPGIAAALDRLGWTPFEKSRILYLGRLVAAPVGHRVDIVRGAGSPWIETQCRLQGYDAPVRSALADIIARMPETAAGLTVFDEDGDAVASVLAVVVDGLAMFTNVVAAAAGRRRGYGRTAMGAALNFAAAAGAAAAAIHVLHDNAPALALYRGFGFGEIGTYLYRRGPPQ